MARRAERRNAQRESTNYRNPYGDPDGNFWNNNDAADDDLAIAELPESNLPLPHVDAADDVLANLDSSLLL